MKSWYLFQRKKSQADPMKFIVGAVLLIVVALLLLGLYRGWFGKAKHGGDQMIQQTIDDCDHDGIKDIVDPCVCDNQQICESQNAQAIASCAAALRERCNAKKNS